MSTYALNWQLRTDPSLPEATKQEIGDWLEASGFLMACLSRAVRSIDRVAQGSPQKVFTEAFVSGTDYRIGSKRLYVLFYCCCRRREDGGMEIAQVIVAAGARGFVRRMKDDLYKYMEDFAAQHDGIIVKQGRWP